MRKILIISGLVLLVVLLCCWYLYQDNAPEGQSAQQTELEQEVNHDQQAAQEPAEPVTTDADFVVPEGIVYKRADEETNAKAKEAIKIALAGGPDELSSLFGDLIVCGPALWNKIKNEKEIVGFTLLPLTVMVPITGGPDQGKTQLMAGGVFRTNEETEAFCVVFDRICEREYRIRLLNETELGIYWAMIPYDIEEPVYVIETPSQKFLIDFSADSMKDISSDSWKVLWVDEMSSYK